MILVTGGTGFIGAYILKELVEQGFRVRAIRRSPRLPQFISASILQQVEWIDGDVLDYVSLEEALAEVDTVIHSAAVVSFHRKDRELLYKTNIEGTTNVVNAAIECGVRRFVHVSSVAALGRKGDGSIVTEEKKWEESAINTHYAISKYHAELEVWRGIAEGLQGVIVNPSTVLGFGDWNSSSCAIFKNAYREFPWYTHGVNGFVDVEDVSRAIVSLMKSDINSERFILNSENWSFQQLLNTMADHFNKKRPSRHATPFLGNIAWRMERLRAMITGVKPLLSRESARVAQSRTHFSNEKILRTLNGFAFKPLEETIAKACSLYLKQAATPVNEPMHTSTGNSTL